jgi:hypothetical protein
MGDQQTGGLVKVMAFVRLLGVTSHPTGPHPAPYRSGRLPVLAVIS